MKLHNNTFHFILLRFNAFLEQFDQRMERFVRDTVDDWEKTYEEE